MITLIPCPACGREISPAAASCPQCAHPMKGPVQTPPTRVKVARSRGVYIILGLVFGLLGFHNFYAGRLFYGTAQLVITVFTGWMLFPLIPLTLLVIAELITVKRDGDGYLMK